MLPHVAICGGGPAGVALGIGLVSSGAYEVTIVEKRFSDETDIHYGSRSYPVDVTARGMRALKELGIHWSELMATGCVDSFEGHAHCHWHHDIFEEFSFDEAVLGTRDNIVCALLYVAKARNLKICRIQHEVTHINLERKMIDEFGPFDLIVGADGKNSSVREALKRAGRIAVRQRHSRIGETTFKSFRMQADPSSSLKRGWLYLHLPTHAVFSLVPNTNTAIGIMPEGKSLHELPSRFAVLITSRHQQEYEKAPMANAGGGFVVSDVALGDGFALIGDAAVSPPPAGQGINHAFDAAASLFQALTRKKAQSNNLESILLEWNQQRKVDEAAYALFGDAQKPIWLRAACLLSSPLGLHTWSGYQLKVSSEPYSKLTSIPSLLIEILGSSSSPLPPSKRNSIVS